jgi:hypothetical protein
LCASHRHDLLENMLLAPLKFARADQTLIVRLATQAPVLASPAHTEPLDELLREDLPKGFFTTLTP